MREEMDKVLLIEEDNPVDKDDIGVFAITAKENGRWLVCVEEGGTTAGSEISVDPDELKTICLRALDLLGAPMVPAPGPGLLVPESLVIPIRGLLSYALEDAAQWSDLTSQERWLISSAHFRALKEWLANQ